MRVMVIVKASADSEAGIMPSAELLEAMEWAQRCPNPMPGPSDLEIRPLYEMSDFE